MLLSPQTVIAYHGTSAEQAAEILQLGFQHSNNSWDWLGTGIYFWQDAPLRAWEWAEEAARQSGRAPAVLGAEIRLSDCMDFLDITWTQALREIYERLQKDYYIDNKDSPVNQDLAHYLDKIVIDYAVERLHSIYNIHSTYAVVRWGLAWEVSRRR